MNRGTSGWLSCATAVFLFHALGWGSRYTKQIIFGVLMAYQAQPEPSKVLIYELIWKGLQYALIGIVSFQAVRCLLPVASTTTTRWTGQGKVLLFPCEITHSRLFPNNHSFAYSYLVIGIPIGWEGVAGGLVSSMIRKTAWSPLLMMGWYNVDPADHFERGGAYLGLRGKLDAYLKSQVRAGHLNGPTSWY